MKTIFRRILAATALCLAAGGITSCRQNVLTITAGRDYFTPELQQQIHSTGWQIVNHAFDGASDRKARKVFRLKRADVHGGECRYHIYYHEQTKQIVLFVKNEIAIKGYKTGIPLYQSSNSFSNTAEFPLYVSQENEETYLPGAERHRLDAALGGEALGWLDVFISVHCKKFYEYEMKHFGKSVYEEVFKSNKKENK